jgi:hypothetical protein
MDADPRDLITEILAIEDAEWDESCRGGEG